MEAVCACPTGCQSALGIGHPSIFFPFGLHTGGWSVSLTDCFLPIWPSHRRVFGIAHRVLSSHMAFTSVGCRYRSPSTFFPYGRCIGMFVGLLSAPFTECLISLYGVHIGMFVGGLSAPHTDCVPEGRQERIVEDRMANSNLENRLKGPKQ